MAEQKYASISLAQANTELQVLMNAAVMAPNHMLEEQTKKAYDTFVYIENHLPAEKGLSNYYLLFNAWIRWMADWDNYSLNMLHRRRLIGHLNRELGIGKFRLEIYPYSSKLYSIKPEGGKVLIQLHEALDFMDEYDCRRFAHCVKLKKWDELKQMLAGYQKRNPQWKELTAYFQAVKANPTHEDRPRGRYYDLEEVFNACNRRCFGGKMPRPKVIHWSPRVNHSTMGSYNVNEDILMINRGLDRSDVPAYVLDFVMYHELLHKALGVKDTGTRHLAHTKEFRDFEKRHPDYERAQAFIQKNAKRL